MENEWIIQEISGLKFIIAILIFVCFTGNFISNKMPIEVWVLYILIEIISIVNFCFLNCGEGNNNENSGNDKDIEK